MNILIFRIVEIESQLLKFANKNQGSKLTDRKASIAASMMWVTLLCW